MAALALAGLLAGCSTDSGGPSLPDLPKISDLNPFAEKEKPLPGKRVAVLTEQDQLSANIEAAIDGPPTLPPMVANQSWSQPGGVPGNAPGHLSLEGGLKTVWSSDAGQGSSSNGRLTASPIVHEGRLYVLDAAGTVSSYGASGGGRAWAVSLTPETEDAEEGYGGGLAAEGDKVFAATGFGTTVALDVRSGAKAWEKRLGAPVRASPTVADGKVYVMTIEGRLFCLSAADGAELWSFRGAPQTASLFNNVSPAVAEDLVVTTFPSGEVVALNPANGEPVWSDVLGASRVSSSIATLSDASRPVIDGNAVYAVGNAGRMIAVDRKSGARLWSLSVASIQMPYVAGDSVYVVDAGGRLSSITREAGSVRWSVKLPDDSTWSGPVLAGNRLWLVSRKGSLVGVDAATGKVVSSRGIGAKVLIAPVVAAGRLFVLADDATVLAFN
jgi:outer membrane protein assembly factor BamB